MSGSFLERLPTLSEAELHRYVERPQAYKTETVAAALTELERRGVAILTLLLAPGFWFVATRLAPDGEGR